MIEIKNKKECCGCQACFNICPKNAISMKNDENGFKIPIVDKEKCIDCGKCEKVCPIINCKKVENNPKAYAMYNLNEKNRMESSSGGIFTLIAETILDLNGIVFGATFKKGFIVEHDYIENKEDLYRFRGSKYVQSDIKESYKKVKDFLNDNRYVLFTGTPCQIEGLKAYLEKEYDKLYTQDIICHGVPSPKVWKEYLKYRENQDHKEAVEINFRKKDNGWNSYEMFFKYKDGHYKKSHSEDLYMKSFLRNASLRESCYNCKFKKVNRISDITLADFWGVNKILSNFNDDKGVSLVIVNTKKGKEILEKIKTKTEWKEVDFGKAIQYNKSMITSAKQPEKRNEFLENINSSNFKKIVKKYTDKPNLYKTIKIKIKKYLR